jgi:flavorubredoxin
MKPHIVQVTPSVKWIGALDQQLTTFDVVMHVKYGTSYNAYIIDAPKITLVETVKHTHTDDYLNCIKCLCNPADIAYIVLNHTEPDHSGSLEALLAIAPNATIVGSGRALAYLADIVQCPLPHTLQVKDGDTLDIGGKTLRFISAPNLHWPDSMYTYLEGEGALFTCDSFGAHYCTPRVFDDCTDTPANYEASFDYYFDSILRPFSKFMLKAIEKIRPLDIKAICTGHGPVLRRFWQEMVDRTERMATQYLQNVDSRRDKILVCYVSAYGYTRQMAEYIARGIALGGKEAKLMDIEVASIAELETALIQADGILVGSPTINQNTLLPVYKLFAAMNPLRDAKKSAAAFGSYGWSGEAADIIEATLTMLKLNVIMPAFKTKFKPNTQTAEMLIDFGKTFADKMYVH